MVLIRRIDVMENFKISDFIFNEEVWLGSEF